MKASNCRDFNGTRSRLIAARRRRTLYRPTTNWGRRVYILSARCWRDMRDGIARDFGYQTCNRMFDRWIARGRACQWWRSGSVVVAVWLATSVALIDVIESAPEGGPRRCQEITILMCRGIGYNHTSTAMGKNRNGLIFHHGRDYLVTVDCYSSFFEIDFLSDTSSKSVISKLKHHFARHGIPDVVISDGDHNTVQVSLENLRKPGISNMK